MTAADFDRALVAARRRSPDLMSIDDKCDVAFGRQDEAEESRLLECVAYYDRIRGGERR